MEALTDLKNALRENEDDDIAARVAGRHLAEQASRPAARAIEEAKGVDRRRIIAVFGAAALLISGAGGRAIWSGLAAPTNNQLYTTPTHNYFRYVDSIYASGGMTAVQAVYAAGTDSDAAKVILWVRQRKNPATYSFLVSCMMDPRLSMRSGAVNEALLLPPVDLKPHLLMMQAAHAAETVPSLQLVMANLILQVQNS